MLNAKPGIVMLMCLHPRGEMGVYGRAPAGRPRRGAAGLSLSGGWESTLLACDVERLRLRRLRTDELTTREVQAIRQLLTDAFGRDEEEQFTEDDWQHAIGGAHFVLDVEGEILAHASVVERSLHVGGAPLRTGYVEAVATAPGHQRRGFGTLILHDVSSYIAQHVELGALGTRHDRFYQRFGWQTWRGPSSVRTPSGERRTPDEDGYIMVLLTPASPVLDLTLPISCDWRPGDVW